MIRGASVLHNPQLGEANEIIRVVNEPNRSWWITVAGPPNGTIECEWGSGERTVRATGISVPRVFGVIGTEVRVVVPVLAQQGRYTGVVAPCEGAPTLLPDPT